MKRTIYTCLLACLYPALTQAQAIDNTLSYKNINTDGYFRLNYENDFFSATDIYYTQGIHAEVVSPWVKKFPLIKLLLHPHYDYVRYGLGLEHEGYTPTSISSDKALIGDRPFAACFFLKTFVMATDTVNKQRFSTSISTGLIGPGAGGKEMQVGIHKALHDITPHGWSNQVQNDAILNYQSDYEKQLLSLGHLFSLDADAMARVGTLSDKVAIGSSIMIGYFDSPFSSAVAGKNSFRIYAYEHPEFDVIGYDATLEGGVFNKTSPYTISAADISRITFQNRFGFVVIYHRMYLEYFQSYVSNEFKMGNYHVWGGVQIAFGI